MSGAKRRRLPGLSAGRLIPNALTLLALCAGATAIRLALTERWELAVAAVAVAMLLDALDGRIARLMGATSKFGAELEYLDGSDLEEVVFQHFPRLKERTKQSAGTLSGGEQQMLAMGRALMSAPKLLLLDEPSLGLSPIMCGEIAAIIRDIHAEGRTVVLVEQNARLALALAQHAYVIETGDIVLSGPAEELRENDEVKKAYLGG